MIVSSSSSVVKRFSDTLLRCNMSFSLSVILFFSLTPTVSGKSFFKVGRRGVFMSESVGTSSDFSNTSVYCSSLLLSSILPWKRIKHRYNFVYIFTEFTS